MNHTNLSQAGTAFFQHLSEEVGIKESTRKTYLKDWLLIENYFGATRKLKNILTVHVAAFAKSEALIAKSDGGRKSDRTIDKTARLFRIFLDWCVETGRLEKAPIPRKTRLGRLTVAEREERRKAA